MNAVPPPLPQGIQTITYLRTFISVIVLVGMMNSMFSLQQRLGEHDRARGSRTPTTSWRGEILRPCVRLVRRVQQMDGTHHLSGRAHQHRPRAARGRDDRRGASCGHRFQSICRASCPPCHHAHPCASQHHVPRLDKVYSMQKRAHYSVSEVLSTHIYKMGIQSTSTATRRRQPVQQRHQLHHAGPVNRSPAALRNSLW